MITKQQERRLMPLLLLNHLCAVPTFGNTPAGSMSQSTGLVFFVDSFLKRKVKQKQKYLYPCITYKNQSLT